MVCKSDDSQCIDVLSPSHLSASREAAPAAPPSPMDEKGDWPSSEDDESDSSAEDSSGDSPGSSSSADCG